MKRIFYLSAVLLSVSLWSKPILNLECVHESGYERVSVFNVKIDFDKNIVNGLLGTYDCCGYLTVHFSNNIPEAPYWVIELGPIESNLYDYSIVSDNKRHSLYVLTRNVERFYQKYNETVISSLQEFGFTQIFNTPFIMEQKNCINL